MNINFIHNPLEDDIKKIYDGLVDFNESYFPNFEEKSFACFINDNENKVVGGLSGKITYNNMLIDYFWLPKSYRSSGVGTRIINQAIKEAITLKLRYINLDTYTFQAPDFYLKMGFVEVGRFKDYPKIGTDKVFYQKKLHN